MSKATEDALAALHGALADEMRKRLQSGEVDAATLNAIRQFLKDNHVEADPAKSPPLRALREAEDALRLPFPGEVPH